ncbi:MAG: Hsp20/alpha crystallin family protein [Candidatus Paceibacterota bacterium]
MPKDKKSFFERLTGSVHVDQEETNTRPDHHKHEFIIKKENDFQNTDNEEGELTVDVYQTPKAVVIKTMAAGVKPENLNISITRDTVTIRGQRESEKSVSDDDYFCRELYWGSFSRTVVLPQEIDLDGVEASEHHGLLTITLPKIDKDKEAKIKIKSL